MSVRRQNKGCTFAGMASFKNTHIGSRTRDPVQNAGKVPVGTKVENEVSKFLTQAVPIH